MSGSARAGSSRWLVTGGECREGVFEYSERSAKRLAAEAVSDRLGFKACWKQRETPALRKTFPASCCSSAC